jgi:hypothetical protein
VMARFPEGFPTPLLVVRISFELNRSERRESRMNFCFSSQFAPDSLTVVDNLMRTPRVCARSHSAVYHKEGHSWGRCLHFPSRDGWHRTYALTGVLWKRPLRCQPWSLHNQGSQSSFDIVTRGPLNCQPVCPGGSTWHGRRRSSCHSTTPTPTTRWQKYDRKQCDCRKPDRFSPQLDE